MKQGKSTTYQWGAAVNRWALAGAALTLPWMLFDEAGRMAGALGIGEGAAWTAGVAILLGGLMLLSDCTAWIGSATAAPLFAAGAVAAAAMGEWELAAGCVAMVAAAGWTIRETFPRVPQFDDPGQLVK